MIIPDINLFLCGDHLVSASSPRRGRWQVPRHLQIAFALLNALGTARNLTTDAQLAAYAIENNAELHSHDVEFGRFDGLRWIDPLRER